MFVWIVREFRKVSYCIRHFTNTVRIIEGNKNTLYRTADCGGSKKGLPHPAKINRSEPGKKDEVLRFEIFGQLLSEINVTPHYRRNIITFRIIFVFISFTYTSSRHDSWFLFSAHLNNVMFPWSVINSHVPYYPLFSRFKKFREIKVPLKKGAAKIEDGKFSALYENLYLSFPSARSSVLEGGLKFQFSPCPYSSSSDSSC